MSEQKHAEKQKHKNAPEEEVQEAKDLRNEELTESTEEVLDSIDDVLDDELLSAMDEVLGDAQEAEALVRNYVQQGGE